jgi:hypothetical protein
MGFAAEFFAKGEVREAYERLKRNLAPGDRFELATLWFATEEVKNLNALSGVACKKTGAVLISLTAPSPAPKSFSIPAFFAKHRHLYRLGH